MGGGFCCGMHAVLRHFVNAAQRLLLMKSEKLIQRAGALADRVGLSQSPSSRMPSPESRLRAIANPPASCARMADENVQPDPCVFGLFTWSPPKISTSFPCTARPSAFPDVRQSPSPRCAPISTSFLPRHLHSLQVLHFQASQKFCFRNVRSDHAHATSIIRRARISIQQYPAIPRCPPWDGKRDPAPRARICECPEIPSPTEAFARFASMPIFTPAISISSTTLQLRAQRGRRRCVHRHNSLRGLHRQRRHRRHAIAIVRRKSFQVSGRARAAGRIKSRNRQQDRWCVV